jgi:prolipoprotein diacylglyceryl transferase
MYLYSRTKEISPKGFMWMLDRIILTIPVGGAFIRIGNLMNSEIYGKPTDVSWAFIYVRDVASGNLPRHPTQIYEAIAYFISFFILFNYYKKRKSNVPKGGLFGLFLILIFGVRFFVEYLKENQVPFENTLPLNMGQLLSIPFVIVGLIFYIRSQRLSVVKVD